MADDHFSISHLSSKELQRIFSKIQISSEYSFNGTPCWLWRAGISKHGYGKIFFRERPSLIHRVMFAWLVSPIPTGKSASTLQIDHLCKRKHCANPAHLELVLPVINVHRSNNICAQNMQKTHCKRGHPLTEENVQRLNGGKWRQCMICRRLTNRINKRARMGYNLNNLRGARRCEEKGEEGF